MLSGFELYPRWVPLTSVFVSRSFGLGMLEMPEPLVFVGVHFGGRLG